MIWQWRWRWQQPSNRAVDADTIVIGRLGWPVKCEACLTATAALRKRLNWALEGHYPCRCLPGRIWQRLRWNLRLPFLSQSLELALPLRNRRMSRIRGDDYEGCQVNCR